MSISPPSRGLPSPMFAQLPPTPPHTRTIIILDEAIKEQHFLTTLDLKNLKNDISKTTIRTSQWAHVVSAAAEYCRLVWDLFYNETHITYAVATNNRRKFYLCPSYDKKKVSNQFDTMLNFYSSYHKKRASPIDAAALIYQLVQLVVQAAQTTGQPISNCPLRVIFVSRTEKEIDFRGFNNVLSNAMNHVKHQLQVDSFQIYFSFLNTTTVPNGNKIRNKETEYHEVDITTFSPNIIGRFTSLAEMHYGLVRTIVRNIPMKEQQQEKDAESINYNVSLLHLKLRNWDDKISRTLELKWETSKTDNREIYASSDAVRICPLDVNDRPTACLTNFIANRTVFLKKEENSEINTHMLTSHGGDIYRV